MQALARSVDCTSETPLVFVRRIPYLDHTSTAMTTKITATFTDGDESIVRTLTLPHDVSDRVGELIGFGLLAELPCEWDSDAFNVEVHRDGGDSWSPLDDAHARARTDRSPSHDCHDELPRLGDIIEITRSVPGISPPVGHRAVVTAIASGDLHPVAIAWYGKTCWLRVDEFKRIPHEPMSEQPYAVGDTVEVTRQHIRFDPPVGTRLHVFAVDDSAVKTDWREGGTSGWWLPVDRVKRVSEQPASTPPVAPSPLAGLSVEDLAAALDMSTTELLDRCCVAAARRTRNSEQPAVTPTTGTACVDEHAPDSDRMTFRPSNNDDLLARVREAAGDPHASTTVVIYQDDRPCSWLVGGQVTFTMDPDLVEPWRRFATGETPSSKVYGRGATEREALQDALRNLDSIRNNEQPSEDLATEVSRATLETSANETRLRDLDSAASDAAAPLKHIRITFACVPDDGESIVLEVDGVRRTRPFGHQAQSLSQLRDQAIQALALILVTSHVVDYRTIEIVARRVRDVSTSELLCVLVDEVKQPNVNTAAYQAPTVDVLKTIAELLYARVLSSAMASTESLLSALRKAAADTNTTGPALAYIEQASTDRAAQSKITCLAHLVAECGYGFNALMRAVEGIAEPQPIGSQVRETTEQSGESQTDYGVGDLIEVRRPSSGADPQIGYQTHVEGLGSDCVYINWNGTPHWVMTFREIKLVKRAGT